MAQSSDPVIGFDLGGTKMLAAVFSQKYKILGTSKKKTRATGGGEAVFERMVKTADEAVAAAGLKMSDIAGLGIGSPGPLDPFEGVIESTPNLGFENFPLKARLQKALDLPVAVDNDVNMGTYGEFHFGAGKGCRHLVGMFPGTGIGGGLILNGELYRGATGGAGEIGHMIIQIDGPLCGCGQHGCIEALASRLSIAKDAVAMAARGDAPGILATAGTDLVQVKSKALAAAMEAGDEQIRALVLRSAGYLGVAMANVVNLLSPEMIVLGGGLIEALPREYLATAEKSMHEHAMSWLVEKVKVKAAKLGDDAVIMGAAKLIRDHLEDGRKSDDKKS